MSMPSWSSLRRPDSNFSIPLLNITHMVKKSRRLAAFERLGLLVSEATSTTTVRLLNTTRWASLTEFWSHANYNLRKSMDSWLPSGLGSRLTTVTSRVQTLLTSPQRGRNSWIFSHQITYVDVLKPTYSFSWWVVLQGKSNYRQTFESQRS